jgi:quinol monooxygenase YgiN
MVLSGEAYYQEEGKPKQLLRKGDVVTTAPNVRHWNGATPWSDAECMTVSEIAPGEQHAVQLRMVTEEEFTNPITYEKMIVRIAEIEVYPQYLEEYLAYANEVDCLSVEREPGVVCLFPMQSAEDSKQIRILEIYASEEAYQAHLKTDHFQKYKQGTLHMVKSLKLPTMRPLDPETMKLIFTKQR